MLFDEAERIKLGQHIRDQRQSKHLTQEELAAECEMGRQHLGYLEAGKRETSYVNLVEVFRTLEISLDAYFLPEIIDEKDELTGIFKAYWKYPKFVRNYLFKVISAAFDLADIFTPTKEEDRNI